jgi:endonuclease/exonuclease/phosphatase family metal-dependent hydrolase
MRVVFASYNIQYSKGQDDRYDLGRVAREVEAADVICCQEVESGYARTAYEDQAERLAALLNRHVAYGAMSDTDASWVDAAGRVHNRRRRFGNAVLSRWPIRSTRTIALPFLPAAGQLDLQRCAVEAVVMVPGAPLRVYSLHLSHLSPAQRIPQIETLMRAVASAPRDGMAWTHYKPEDPTWTEGQAEPAPPEPCALFGDFNLKPSDPEYPLLTGAMTEERGRLPRRDQFFDGWVAAGNAEASGWTVAEKAGQEGERIDFGLFSPALASAIRRAWIDTEARGSDHLPIFFELELGA